MYAALKALKLHKIKNVKCVPHLFCFLIPNGMCSSGILLNAAFYPFKDKFRKKCFKNYGIFNFLKIIILKSTNSRRMEHIRRNS